MSLHKWSDCAGGSIILSAPYSFAPPPPPPHPPNRVIDGWETLDDLEKVPVHEKTFKPTTDIRLRRVTIHANPIAN